MRRRSPNNPAHLVVKKNEEYRGSRLLAPPLFKSPVASDAVKESTDTGNDNEPNQDLAKISGDVEDDKKHSVTNEVALSSSMIDPTEEALDTQAIEVNETSNSTEEKKGHGDTSNSIEAKRSHGNTAQSFEPTDALTDSTDHVDIDKFPDAADEVNYLTDTGKDNESNEEAGKMMTNKDALASATGCPPNKALETQAELVNNTLRAADAKDIGSDIAKSPDASKEVQKSTDTDQENDTNEDNGEILDSRHNHSSRRRSTRKDSRNSLRNNVKSEVVHVMQHHNAIGEAEIRLRDVGVRYPEEYVGLLRCHFRSLYCVCPDAARKAYNQKISHLDIEKLKELVANNAEGGIFWVWQEAWVSLTRMYFFPDSICYKVINHSVAEYILKFSEFRIEYATMVLPDTVKKTSETHAGVVNKSSFSTEERGNRADLAKSSDAADENRKSRDVDAKMNDSVTNEVTSSFVGKRVLVRCDYNPNYFLNGRVSSIDGDNGIYTVIFDERDAAAPHYYNEYELRKIIFNPVVGIGGASFVTYPGMPVFAYRGEME